LKHIKRLPDSEFELMQIVWQNEPPMSTNQIISRLPSDRAWKPQTVLTLLSRLIEKGFLDSKKDGKERTYAPCVMYDEYMLAETGGFLGRFQNNSLISLVNTLYDGKKLTEAEIADLRDWLEKEKIGRGK